MITELYACYNKNEDVRLKSSSGGLYFLLAQNILHNGGIIFASCYEGLKVKFKRICNEKMLMDSLGSKYIPSDLGDTFSSVKNEILRGKTVLFVGLPCQCSGLLSYINSCLGNVEDKLILVDLVCHGVPAYKAWNSYCESIKNNGFDLSSVNMRDKSTGWKNYSFLMLDSEGKERLESHGSNVYLKGFISNLYLRPSCYNCRFKGFDRDTDITLGDFWGVQNIQSEMDDDKGTSLVFLHSDKGKKLFEDIENYIVSTRTSFDLAAKFNPSIVSQANLPDNRFDFFRRMLEGEDFACIVDNMTKNSLSLRVKKKIKKLLKNASF